MPVPKGYREEKGKYPASKCAPTSFRVKVLSETKRIVVCCPKGSWSHGQCDAGMKETKIQTKIAGKKGVSLKFKKKGERVKLKARWSGGMYGRKKR